MTQRALRLGLALLALLFLLVLAFVQPRVAERFVRVGSPTTVGAPAPAEVGDPSVGDGAERRAVVAAIRGEVLVQGPCESSAPGDGRLRIRRGLGADVDEAVVVPVERGRWRLELDSRFAANEMLFVESFEAEALTLTECTPRAFEARDQELTLAVSVVAWLDLVAIDADSGESIERPEVRAVDPHWTPATPAHTPPSGGRSSIAVTWEGARARILAATRIDDVWVGAPGYLWTRAELAPATMNTVELHRESAIRVSFDGQISGRAAVILDRNEGARSGFHEIRRVEVENAAGIVLLDRIPAGRYRVRVEGAERADGRALGHVELDLASGELQSIAIQLPAVGRELGTSVVARFRGAEAALSAVLTGGAQLVCAEGADRGAPIVRVSGDSFSPFAGASPGGIESRSIACRPGWYWLQVSALNWGCLVEILPGENLRECVLQDVAPVRVRLLDSVTSAPVHTNFVGVVSVDRSADADHTAFPTCVLPLSVDDGSYVGRLVTGPAVLVVSSPTHGAMVIPFEHREEQPTVDLRVEAAAELVVEALIDGHFAPLDSSWLSRLRVASDGSASCPAIVRVWTTRDQEGRVRARVRLSSRRSAVLVPAPHLGLVPLAPAKLDWPESSQGEHVVRFEALASDD